MSQDALALLALATIITFYFGVLKAYHAIILLKQRKYFLSTFVPQNGTPVIEAKHHLLTAMNSTLDKLQKPAALFNLTIMGLGFPIAGAILVGFALPQYIAAYIALCLPYYLCGLLVPREHITEAEESFLGSRAAIVFVVIFKARSFSRYLNVFFTWIPLVLFCVYIILAVRR